MSPVSPPVVRKSFWRALALTLLVAAANVGLWAFLNRPVQIADWRGDIHGLAFNPSQRYQDPTKQLFPSESELDGDIRLLSQYSSACARIPRWRTRPSRAWPTSTACA